MSERPSLSRRTLMSGAALPAVAVLPAIANAAALPPAKPVDPIFAAIVAHRAAWDEFNARCSVLAEAETPEAWAEYEDLTEAEYEAASKLADTAPTTLAGAVALLHYVADVEGRDRSG